MAGDWIKMRTDLLTSPKVVRMASALKADRFRIAGGLLSVWSLFDVHSEDGVLSGYTLETVDDLAAWPGFSEAMVAVEWMIQDGESLAIPRFEAHNGASAKRRAQDSDRKREVRKMSASDADKMRTREEKRREEISSSLRSEDKAPARKKNLSAADLVKMGVDEKHATDWLAVRKQKRAPLTETALNNVIAEAQKAGKTPAQAVEICAKESWQGFKASWLAKTTDQALSRHSGFDQRDYTDGLIDNGDGSYGF